MSKKVYRTAQGKIVDLGALELKNEKTRAVGNMSVNARGELIDAKNNPIESRNQKVNKYYSKQTSSNVSSDPVVDPSAKPRNELVEDPFGPMDDPMTNDTKKDDDGFSLT